MLVGENLLMHCGVDFVSFDYLYQERQQCAQIGNDSFVLFEDTCPPITGVLCKAGAPVAITSSIFTGPFDTETVTFARTETFSSSTTTTSTVSTFTVSSTIIETETVYVATTTTSTATEVVTQTKTSECCRHPPINCKDKAQ